VRVSATLSTILQVTRERIAGLAPDRAELRQAAQEAPPPRPWLAAFGGRNVAVIAEVKRRSPSAGAIAEGLAPATHARAYVAGGAVAISVLTDERHFGGSLADLDAVHGAVQVPLLRKDFIIDETQLYEARIHGASAVLLIVRALDPAALQDLAAEARVLGLARLVEVHEAVELERALRVEPEAVGVNARDLETLRVDVRGSEAVLRAVPPGVLAVAESGLATRADVAQVAAWGADAVLVGTSVARAADPAGAVRGLTDVPRSPRVERAGWRA
jgi:indole-3-glycerol phosphate synthase